MGGYSRALSTSIQEYIHGIDTWTPPVSGNYYVALSTANVTEDGGNLVEPPSGIGAGDYARVVVASTVWVIEPTPTIDTSKIWNSTQVEFPLATATWGFIKSVAVMDAPTGGNMLWFGDLSSIKEVPINTIAVFQAQYLTISSNPT